MKNSVRSKEFIRGKILYYLSLVFPHSSSMPLLQGELDLFGYPVPMEDLEYHVAYLKEKGYVAVDQVRGPRLEREGARPGSLRSGLTLVKITAQGIDYKEGRLPVDEGVYLEP